MLNLAVFYIYTSLNSCCFIIFHSSFHDVIMCNINTTLTFVFIFSLQVAGMQYLHRLLGPIINRIFEEKKYVELDPSKVELKEAG